MHWVTSKSIWKRQAVHTYHPGLPMVGPFPPVIFSSPPFLFSFMIMPKYMLLAENYCLRIINSDVTTHNRNLLWFHLSHLETSKHSPFYFSVNFISIKYGGILTMHSSSLQSLSPLRFITFSWGRRDLTQGQIHPSLYPYTKPSE